MNKLPQNKKNKKKMYHNNKATLINRQNNKIHKKKKVMTKINKMISINLLNKLKILNIYYLVIC